MAFMHLTNTTRACCVILTRRIIETWNHCSSPWGLLVSSFSDSSGQNRHNVRAQYLSGASTPWHALTLTLLLENFNICLTDWPRGYSRNVLFPFIIGTIALFEQNFLRLATVREKLGKIKNFSRSGKSQGICKRSGKISVLVKVSEKSGNFVFRFCEVYEDIFIRKKRSCSRSSFERVFRSVKCHAFKIPWKTERDWKWREEYWWFAEEAEVNVKVNFTYSILHLMQSQWKVREKYVIFWVLMSGNPASSHSYSKCYSTSIQLAITLCLLRKLDLPRGRNSWRWPNGAHPLGTRMLSDSRGQERMFVSMQCTKMLLEEKS